MFQQLEDLTYAINGHATRVHREYGPGLDETYYHRRLSELFMKSGIAHQYKPRGELTHRGSVADVFEPDLIVDHRVCLECKAHRGPCTPDNLTQALSYQKFWQIRNGLLLNFGNNNLLIKRVVYEEPARTTLIQDDALNAFIERADPGGLAAALCKLIARLYQEIGSGYRAKTYRGLIKAELMAEQILFLDQPVALIPHAGVLRESGFDCIVVDGRCAIMTLALRSEVGSTDRAILQTYLRYLDLPWGLAVNFAKTQLHILLVKRQQT